MGMTDETGWFFHLEKEIFTIVQAFHREIYGEIKLTGPELDKIIAATKKKSQPRLLAHEAEGRDKKGIVEFQGRRF